MTKWRRQHPLRPVVRTAMISGCISKFMPPSLAGLRPMCTTRSRIVPPIARGIEQQSKIRQQPAQSLLQVKTRPPLVEIAARLSQGMKTACVCRPSSMSRRLIPKVGHLGNGRSKRFSGKLSEIPPSTKKHGSAMCFEPSARRRWRPLRSRRCSRIDTHD